MKKIPGEGKIGNIFSKVIDLLLVGILWLICSLPIITIGTASSAMYYVVVKCVRHERGHIVRSFFSAFKSNFAASVKVWLIYLAFILLLGFDVYGAGRLGMTFSLIYRMATRIMIIPLLLPLPWVFAYISRFEAPFSTLVRYSMYLSVRNLWRTLLLLVIPAAVLFLCLFLPGLVPVLPGLCCLAMSYVIEPVLKALSEDSDDSNEDQWYNE